MNPSLQILLRAFRAVLPTTRPMRQARIWCWPRCVCVVPLLFDVCGLLRRGREYRSGMGLFLFDFRKSHEKVLLVED
jgi:hypothetical protein